MSPSEPSRFEPRDPDWDQRVRSSFERQEVMKTLGVSIARLEPGEMELRFDHQFSYTQQHGFVHAGILSTVLDSACGYAAFSLMPPDIAVLTVEFKLNLLAPARGQRFRAIARVLKPGRTLTVCDGEVLAEDRGTTRRVATMTGTIMSVAGRDDVEH